MSDANAGTARGVYVLDISSVEQQAAKLRQIFAGIKADAAQASAPLARAPSPATGGASPTAQAADQARIAAAIERRANIEARLTQVQNTGKNVLTGLTQAETIYADALTKVAKNSDAAIRIETQLQSVQNKIANNGSSPILPRSLENFGPEALSQIQSGLLGVVGPAALVTAGFSAARASVDSFVQAFTFTAQLDATNRAIETQVKGVRDSGQLFREASAFADRYKLTQEETGQAIQASIPILRSSNASLTDVEGVLLRLQAKKPEKSISDAARALDELKSGQIVSIVDQFNVSRDAANAMKNEIAAGGDAVQVLSRYLTDAGIGMVALQNRTEGATGALNDYKKAQEGLEIAKGRLAEGPGTNILGAATVATNDVTNALGAGGGFNAVLQNNKALLEANAAAQLAFSLALIKTGSIEQATIAAARVRGEVYRQNAAVVISSTQGQIAAFDEVRTAVGQQQIATQAASDLENRRAIATSAATALNRASAASIHEQANAIIDASHNSVLDAAAKDTQRQKTALLTAETNASVNAFLALNPGIDASGIASLVASGRITELVGQVAALRVEAGNTGPALAQLAAQAAGIANIQKGLTAGLQGSITTPFAKGAGTGLAAFSRAQSDAEKLLDSEIQLASAKGNTAKQIDLLRQKERLYATDQAERNAIEAQIIGIQTAAGKTRVSAAQTTGLQLAQTEENSQAAILKAQREGLERLRDQQSDFDLHRSRDQQDEALKIQSLLAHGQRAQAAEERRKFALDQQRATEDFNIQKNRTLRNNAESTGDINDRTDLRQSQIGDRAALHGVRPAGGTASGLPAPPLPIPTAPAASRQPTIVRIQIAPTSVQIDGHQIIELTWPEIEQRVDTELSEALIQLPPVGGGQSAVAGGRP